MAESIGTIITSDLLGELNLKPWWEEYRGYCFSVSVATALAMIYTLQPHGLLSCLPDGNKTEVTENFPTCAENFVNTFCVSSLPVQFIYAGAIALGCCGLLVALSSYWLHYPKVIDAFETYAGAQTTIEKLMLSAEQLQILSVSIEGKEIVEEAPMVQKVCARIWKNDMEFNIRKCYRCRCWILISCLTLILIAAAVKVERAFQTEKRVMSCYIPPHEVSSINIRNYVCTHNASPIVTVLTIMFALSILCQIVLVCTGLCKTQREKTNTNLENSERSMQHVKELFSFIHIFWKNGRPIDSRTFDEFFEYITTDEPKKLNMLFIREPRLCDIFLIAKYPTMGLDCAKLSKSIRLYLKKKDNDFYKNEAAYAQLLKIMKESELQWQNEVGQLLDLLHEERFLELFVTLLNVWSHPSDKENITEHLFLLKPNRDAISTGDAGRSILYYLKTSDKKQRSFSRILENCVGNAYVHCDGFSYKSCNWQKIHSSAGNDEVQRAIVLNAGYAEVVKILDKLHKNCGNAENIARKISEVKFTPWDDKMNEKAEDLCNKKCWEVLVALMNATIVELESKNKYSEVCKDATKIPHEKFAISDCKLDLADAVSPDKDEELGKSNGLLLYYALSKYDYQPFIFTAAATILSLTKGKEKIVRIDEDTKINQ